MVNARTGITCNVVTQKQKVSIDSIISWFLLVIFFFLVINAALPQLEMLLFSGHVPIPSIAIKFSAIMILVMYSMLHVDLAINKSSIMVLVLLSTLIAIEVCFFAGGNRYPVPELLFGYNTMYSLLIISLLITNFRSMISSRFAGRLILIASIPVVLLGAAQAIMNEPLLPLKSVDDYFQVLVWNYYGQVRSFSLFEAPAYYATFLIFFGGFALGNALCRRRIKSRLFYLALFSVVSMSEFMSLNRTAIFAYIFVSFTVILIYKMNYRKNQLILVMVASFLLSVILVFAVPIISNLFPFVFAFKDQSMLERYSEWQYWLQFLLRSPERVLLGSGIFQNALFSATKEVIIDNMFLAVLVQAGVVGLAIVLYVIYKVWSILVARYLDVSSPMAIASIALLTVWPIFSTFGTGLNIFPVYAAIPFLFKSVNKDSTNAGRIEAIYVR